MGRMERISLRCFSEKGGGLLVLVRNTYIAGKGHTFVETPTTGTFVLLIPSGTRRCRLVSCIHAISCISLLLFLNPVIIQYHFYRITCLILVLATLIVPLALYSVRVLN